MFFLGEPKQAQPQQWPRRQIEGQPRLFFSQARDLGLAPGYVQM
jgi:hypothetical protein